MKIEFYGISHDITKERKVDLELELPVSIAFIRSVLVEKYPKLKELNSFFLALNESYVDEEVLVEQQDDRLALIPPVSGG